MADEAIHPCKKFLLLIVLGFATLITLIGAVLLLAGGGGMNTLPGNTALYGGMCSDVTDKSDTSNDGNVTEWGAMAAGTRKCPQNDVQFDKFLNEISASDLNTMVTTNTTCDPYVDGANKDLIKKAGEGDADSNLQLAQIGRGCQGGFETNPLIIAKKLASGQARAGMQSLPFMLTFLAILFTTIHAVVTNLPFCNKGKSGLILVTSILIGASLALSALCWTAAVGQAGAKAMSVGTVPCTEGGPLAITADTYFGTAEDIYRAMKVPAEKNEETVSTEAIGMLGWKGMNSKTLAKEYADGYGKLTAIEKYYFIGRSKHCATDLEGKSASALVAAFSSNAGLAVAGSAMAFIGLFIMMMVTGWMFKKLNDGDSPAADNKA